MNTIHIYEFENDANLILAVRAARYLDKRDSKDDALLHYGDTTRVYCWRTKAGNISVRLVK